MYNDDSLFFHDFIAFAVMAGIEKSLSEKKKAEKLHTEKDTSEKKCQCIEKCLTKTTREKILNEIHECKNIISQCSTNHLEIFSIKCRLDDIEKILSQSE